MANPQKIKAEVKEIISYGRQVYKLIFTLEKKFPRFKPGQFLHLTLENFDPAAGFWPESRVFSIASCSEDRKEISIVYSVKGSYTIKMEEIIKVGSSLWLKAPYGDFMIPNYLLDGQKAILIAGGTGVSPFIPFLQEVDSSVEIQLNYGLQNKNLIIFENELLDVLKKSNFFMNLYLEELTEHSSLIGNIAVHQGMLSINNILSGIQKKDQSVFFLSGPPLMIESFQDQLIKAGINKEKIIIDAWS